MAIGQRTDSVSTSPATPVAQSCEDKLAIASERLSKALDAYEKATSALNASLAENVSRKALDSLKDEFIAVKDMIIKAQADLITFYQKQKKGNSVWQRVKTILEIAEKVALVAAGILLGGRL